MCSMSRSRRSSLVNCLKLLSKLKIGLAQLSVEKWLLKLITQKCFNNFFLLISFSNFCLFDLVSFECLYKNITALPTPLDFK
jgi:hypothetical protein